MLREPRLKIVRSRVEPRNVGTEGEFKDIYLSVKNVGGKEAIDCYIKANVKNVSQEPYYLQEMPFSLKAGNDTEIHFQQIIKSEQKVRSLSKKAPAIDRGHIYEYEIRFYGNFKDDKAHKLTLDLSSWESIGVTLDC